MNIMYFFSRLIVAAYTISKYAEPTSFLTALPIESMPAHDNSKEGIRNSEWLRNLLQGEENGIPSNNIDATYNINDEDPYCRPLSSSSASNDDMNTLNIHIVPHTHDDVGWLKTVDQYFYGLNNTIQQAHVSLILDNVLNQLLDKSSSNHNRTFTYVETAFFSKWYLSLTPVQQSALKALIANKQFSFVNGGWCMHDEATTHFMGMIDQTTLGHTFLKKELGVVPKVGWQIDPFGHSATQGGLLTKEIGFDALYFGRIHYVDLLNRLEDGECEGLWSSSSSTSEKSVFWGLTGSYRGNYGAPEGFCFDVLCDDSPLIGLAENDLRERIYLFLKMVGEQAYRTKGRNLMLTMGSDFQFSQARKNYQNLDLLIDATTHFLNEGIILIQDIIDSRFKKVKIFYSNPERYTQCKYIDLLNAKRQAKSFSPSREILTQVERKVRLQKSENTLKTVDPTFDVLTWKVKTGDFFPYADCDHCYWTGYFTSRQGLKKLERVGSSYLHASRQIESILKLQQSKLVSNTILHRTISDKDGSDEAKSETGSIQLLPNVKSWSNSPLFQLDDAMGVAQHHDAVSGTSKQHVAYDYAKRIADGIHTASVFVIDALRQLFLDSKTSSLGLLEDLSYCYLLNETTCKVSQEAIESESGAIYVFVYNALAKRRSQIIPLPVGTSAHYSVECLHTRLNDWTPVISSSIPNSNYVNSADAAQVTLFFEARDLPPLGAKVFRVTNLRVEGSIDSSTIRSSDVFASMEGPIISNDPKVHLNNLRTSVRRGTLVSQADSDIIISNGIITVKFDGSSGMIKSIMEETDHGVSLDIQQDYGFYKSFHYSKTVKDKHFSSETNTFEALKGNGKCLPGYIDAEGNEMPWLLGTATEQNSGAYIFRTTDLSLHILPPRADGVTLYETDLVTEVHAELGEAGNSQSWIKQITRLYKGMNYVEVEYIVGPVPVDDNVGKEVVSRFTTSINSNATFFTDSNGREFMKRTRGDNDLYGSYFYDAVDMEPIAGNYYPVNAAIYIEDKNRSFSILVDRSQGGSSLFDGSVELMIHRRLLFDDFRGVAEPLNETDVGITPCAPYGNADRIGKGIIIKGIHRLMIGHGRSGASLSRSAMDETFSQPQVFVSSATADIQIPWQRAELSALETSFPDNVMLVTFVSLFKDNLFLVRLGHQYGKNESEQYSRPASVDLQTLFPNKTIISLTEKTLSGNQNRSEWEKVQLQWDNPENYNSNVTVPHVNAYYHNHELEGSVIVLKPLEIRTFEVSVS